MEPSILIRPGREKSLLRRHPWIFSGAIEKVVGNPQPGETVGVYGQGGEFYAWAAYSPYSQIRARVWTWNQSEKVDSAFLEARLQHALSARQDLVDSGVSDALRLVFAESDGLPGLVVDRYADTLVIQYLTAGAEAWRETLADLVMRLFGGKNLYERSDVDSRRLEGLPERAGLLRGEEPPSRIKIYERGIRSGRTIHYWVDARQGHKTGFYLDQRANRDLVGSLVHGGDVLDCFCYTGGFTAFALDGGADTVTAIDSSAEALSQARDNLILNNLPVDKATFEEGDVFKLLRTYRDSHRSFDTIILDPPKFAPTAAQAERAARGYKDINLLAMKLVRPGGYLVTFSCSGGVSEELFQKILADAALDARVDAHIQARLFQAPDHPVALNFPEGAYLKGFVLRVTQ